MDITRQNFELLEDYLSTRRLSESRRKTFHKALRSYNHIGVLSSATEDSLRRWLNERTRTGNKAATITLYSYALRVLYEHSLQDLSEEVAESHARKLFRCIPITDLRKEAKRDSTYRDQLVTSEEFEELMMAARTAKFRAFIAVLYESGARKGELLSLKIRDISLGGKYTTISVKGKTGERTIPLVKSVPYLRQWLQVHPDGKPGSPLFVSVWGGEMRQLSGGAVNSAFKRFCEKAGIRHINPHMLRHTRLTELAKLGLGEYQLKNFAGWTPDSRMASRYLHLSGRAHIDAVLETEGVEVEKGERRGGEAIFKMKSCPNCGRQIGEDQMFCSNCGMLLDERLQHDRVTEIKKLRADVEDLRRLLRITLEKANVIKA